MDVALILDLSGSIDIVYNQIIRLAEEIVYRLPVGFDRANVGLISYQDQAEVNFYLDTYETQRELLIALQFGSYGGKTHTADALRQTYRDLFTSARGMRNGVPNKGILITDGRSNINEGNTIREAENAKGRDIELYVVAVGEGPDMNEVNGIASDPDSEYVFRLESENDIEDIADQIMEALCES